MCRRGNESVTPPSEGTGLAARELLLFTLLNDLGPYYLII